MLYSNIVPEEIARQNAEVSEALDTLTNGEAGAMLYLMSDALQRGGRLASTRAAAHEMRIDLDITHNQFKGYLRTLMGKELISQEVPEDYAGRGPRFYWVSFHPAVKEALDGAFWAAKVAKAESGVAVSV